MIGTIVNAIAIIIGSLVGGFFKRLMNENLNNRLLETMGLAAFGIGINSVVQNMPDSNYPVLFIASLALGCVAGTLLKIDERVGKLTSSKGNDSNLATGIITGGDHTFLFTNATLDLVTSMVLASAYGVGMIVCAAVLVIWQGSIYALTLLAGNVLTDNMMTELSIVGGFLIAMTGLNIMGVKKFKTLDYLPALLIPLIWCAIAG